MTTIKQEQQIEFVCIGLCGLGDDADPPVWMVEGRFNADGGFEPFDEFDMDCQECDERGEPTNTDVRLSD
jgi:hypothetical protein